MSRSSMLIAAAGAALLAAIAVGVGGAAAPTAAPGRSFDILSAVLATPATRWTLGVALGSIVFFVIAHLGPGVRETVRLARLHRRLEQPRHAAASPEDYSALTRGTTLERPAGDFVAALWRPDGEQRNWWATTPAATFFDRAASALEAVAETHGRIGYVALGGGFVGLLLAVSAIAWGVPTRADLFARIAVFGAGTFVGVGIVVLARTLALVQKTLIAAIAAETDRLFPALNGNSLLTQLERALAREAGRVVERTGTLLGSHDKRLAAAVADAVERATAPVAERLVTVAERLETDHAAAGRQLLQGALDAFAAEHRARFGDAQEEIARALAATRDAAEALRQGIADAASQARETHDRRETHLFEALQWRFEEAAGRHAAATEAAVARLDDVMRGFVERGAGELSRAMHAFNQLNGVLDTLSVSVLPALNRLVETQDAIEAVLRESRAGGENVARTATALAEAVRLARDTVERQVVLAKEISGGGAKAPAPAEPRDLAGVLDSLRSETDAALRSLPRI